MSYANVSLKQRSFGETMRRGAWWAQPLFVFLGLSTFLVYSTWAAFQGTHYWLDQNGANYLSPFYSPELFRQLAACNFWTEAWLVAIVAVIFTRAFGSVGTGGFSAHLLLLPRRLLQSVLGRPTHLCCWRAAKGISGRKFVSAHHAKHSPLLPLSRACCSFSFSRTTRGRRCGLRMHPVRSISGSALERLCSR